MQKKYKIILFFLTFLIVTIFYFSLVPKFNGFPTGIDAPHHIMWAKAFAENNYPPAFLWKGENPSPYPLPEIIFAMTHLITRVSFEALFPYMIISFLLLTILMAALIAKYLFGFYESIVVMILGVGLPFFSEHLPIGTLAEAFGMLILFTIFYFFIKKKYLLSVIFVLIGLFSHPFVGLFTGVIIMFSLPFLLLSKKGRVFIARHKVFIISFLIGLIVIIILITTLFIDQLKNFRLFNMLLSDDLIIKGGKSYTLLEIIQRTELLPMVYLLGLFGLIVFLRSESNSNKTFFALLGLIFSFLIFNHQYYINIEPYRFIPYLEIFISIFAGFGLIYLFNKLKRYSSKKLLIFIILIILIFPVFFAYNNIKAIEKTINYYSTPESLAKLPKDDLEVMSWLKNNNVVGDQDYICTLYKWGYWLPALAEEKVIFSGYEKVDESNPSSCNRIFTGKDEKQIIEDAKSENLKYVYFSSHQPGNSLIENNFKLIYKKGEAAIYQIY